MRPMNSVLVEYFRFDDLDVGVLSAGKRYILTHKDLAVKEVQTTGGETRISIAVEAISRQSDLLSDPLEPGPVIWREQIRIGGREPRVFERPALAGAKPGAA